MSVDAADPSAPAADVASGSAANGLSPDGPSSAFNGVVMMDELLDKLRLLDFEKSFPAKSSARISLNQHFFALATNPGEQFFMFTNVAAWLIRLAADASFEMPHEFDDPNATISKIIDQVRTLGHNVDFAPNKLKPGAGEQCVYVLDRLADSALVKQQFAWSRMAAVPEEPEDADVGADEAEVLAEEFADEDEEPEMADDDDDGGFLDLQAMRPHSGHEAMETETAQKSVLKSNTDALEWKMEVERVLPSLKVVVRQDAKDWRSHLEQMQTYQQNINTTLGSTRGQLDRLGGEVQKNLEKIHSRERYLNSHLESLLAQFRSAQDRLAEAREKYKEASGGVTDRSRELAILTEELEGVRQEMEQRGVSLTDGAPLVKLKQAIQSLEAELVGMEVGMGVVEQALLQSQLRDTHSHSTHMLM